MDFFDDFDKLSPLKKKWISVQSELEGIDGKKKDIQIELMDDGMPRAIAFFDIVLAQFHSIHL